MNLLDFLGLQQFKSLINIIKFHGGVRKFVLFLVRYDEEKIGKLVGIDKFGNKYYENDYYMIGKNRWVIYSPKFGYDYDASQVPAEWYGWLHYKSEYPPHEDKTRPNYKWMLEYDENLTGTSRQYVPFSTTQKKIHAWVPPTHKK